MRLTQFLQQINPLNRLTKEMQHMNENLTKVKALVDDIHTKTGVVLEKLTSAKEQITDLQTKVAAASNDAEDQELIASIGASLQVIDDQVSGALGAVSGTPPATGESSATTTE